MGMIKENAIELKQKIKIVRHLSLLI